MILALYILMAIVAVGVVLKLTDRRPRKPGDEPATADAADTTGGDDDGECCGMHITCERDSLLAGVSERAEYFDDEELDAYAGRDPESYTPEETEQFREVLLTLLPDDIAPWARSIQLRGITLPPEVREELLMIVSEERAKRESQEK